MRSNLYRKYALKQRKRAINNYLDKERLWLSQCHIFRIFVNSANKRQTTVTMNQILTQKWFLLQNIKDSSLNLTFVIVFSITENGHTALLPVCPSFTKNFKLKQVYATKNTSMHSRYLWAYVQNLKGFVAFLLRPTVPTKVWTGAYTPTLIFLEVGSI
jgi:hypothetical protein